MAPNSGLRGWWQYRVNFMTANYVMDLRQYIGNQMLLIPGRNVFW